jgi:hypothetical protein
MFAMFVSCSRSPAILSFLLLSYSISDFRPSICILMFLARPCIARSGLSISSRSCLSFSVMSLTLKSSLSNFYWISMRFSCEILELCSSSGISEIISSFRLATYTFSSSNSRIFFSHLIFSAILFFFSLLTTASDLSRISKSFFKSAKRLLACSC